MLNRTIPDPRMTASANALLPIVPPQVRGRACRRVFGRCWGSFLALMLLTGCVSKPAAREQSREAYEAGMRRERLEAELRRTNVIFRGPVEHPYVPWREGLTLSEAIVAAVYVGTAEPRLIVVTRGEARLPVNAAELLDGAVILVEPGDTVEFVP